MVRGGSREDLMAVWKSTEFGWLVKGEGDGERVRKRDGEEGWRMIEKIIL